MRRTADSVTIDKEGKEYTLPIAKLSRADQAYLDRKHPVDALQSDTGDSLVGSDAADGSDDDPSDDSAPSFRPSVEPAGDTAANSSTEPRRSYQPTPAESAPPPIVQTPTGASGHESWTLRTGELVEGSLLRMVGDRVLLWTGKGTTILPFTYFSPSDQERIQETLSSGSDQERIREMIRSRSAARSAPGVPGSMTNSSGSAADPSAAYGAASAAAPSTTGYPNAASAHSAGSTSDPAYASAMGASSAASAAPGYPSSSSNPSGSTYSPAPTDYPANSPSTPTPADNAPRFAGTCLNCLETFRLQSRAGGTCPHCGVYLDTSAALNHNRQVAAQGQTSPTGHPLRISDRNQSSTPPTPSWSSGSDSSDHSSGRIRFRGLGKLIVGAGVLLCSLFAGFVKFLLGGGYSNETWND